MHVERGFEKAKLCGSVYTQKGVKSSHVIKCVERVFCFACLLFCLNLRCQSVWEMCGKGIIFINTFHTIRVLSNFSGAGYATFPSGHPRELLAIKNKWWSTVIQDYLYKLSKGSTIKHLGGAWCKTKKKNSFGGSLKKKNSVKGASEKKNYDWSI